MGSSSPYVCVYVIHNTYIHVCSGCMYVTSCCFYYHSKFIVVHSMHSTRLFSLKNFSTYEYHIPLKSMSWKNRRRLLQRNSGTFPCEARLQKWGKHPDGICGLCKRCQEMGLKLLGGKSPEVPRATCRAAYVGFRPLRPLARTTRASSKCRRT